MWCTVCMLHLFHWSRNLVDRDGKLKNCQRRIQDYMEDRPASPLRLEDSLLPLHSHRRSLVQSIYTSVVSMNRQEEKCTWKNNTQQEYVLLYKVEFASAIHSLVQGFESPQHNEWRRSVFYTYRHIVYVRFVKEKKLKRVGLYIKISIQNFVFFFSVL